MMEPPTKLNKTHGVCRLLDTNLVKPHTAIKPPRSDHDLREQEFISLPSGRHKA